VTVPTPGRLRTTAAFSLIELLIAVTLAGVVSCAGWAWCWSSTGVCARSRDRLEASSSLAFVRRLATTELHGAACLLNTPSCSCTGHSLVCAVPASDGRSLQLVSYAWDEHRGVVWRKAPGSHLVEGATRFDVAYSDDANHPVACGSDGRLTVTGLASVRCVEFTLTVAVGALTVTERWRVGLGAGGARSTS